MITKEDIIVAFKNSCVLIDIQTVMKRSMSVEYQNQRNIWEIHNKWLGLIRIEDRVNAFFIRLFPLLENGFHLKNEVVFEITKSEFEDLKTLYFGEFKEDEGYFKRMNALYVK